jgi:hypothetical protein
VLRKSKKVGRLPDLPQLTAFRFLWRSESYLQSHTPSTTVAFRACSDTSTLANPFKHSTNLKIFERKTLAAITLNQCSSIAKHVQSAKNQS